MVTLRLKNLSIGYDRPIIEDIDVEFRGRSLVQIMGPNGAGKTTLLKTIIGILKPLKGSVFVDNDEITGNPEKAGIYVSYVPQIATYVLGDVFPISVWEFVEFEVEAYVKQRRLNKKDIVTVVHNTLEVVEIPKELWFKGINKLSGGQRQRLLIARALVRDTPIVVMDEPLSAVDVDGRVTLAKIIGKLKEKNKTILITCHDPELMIEYTDYVMLLGNGTYVFGKPEEILQPSILTKFYRTSFIELEKHVHIHDFHI